jgi:hypothetical protein
MIDVRFIGDESKSNQKIIQRPKRMDVTVTLTAILSI